MDNIEEELTCSICYSIFEDPRILPCSHTFCRNCLESVINSSENYLWRPSMLRLTCPSCRGIAELSATGIRGLPVNFALKSIIEKYNPNDHCGTTKCPEHPKQPLNVFCLKDRTLVCGHCLTVGHHTGHPIDDLQSAYIKEKETACKLLETLSDKNFTGVSCVIKKLEEQMAYSKRVVQDDKNEVLKYFDKLNESLEKKKQNILAVLNDVNQQIVDLYSPLIERMKQVQDEEIDVISLCRSTQEDESPLTFLENIHNIHQRMQALKKQQLVKVHPVVIHPRIGQFLKDKLLKTNVGDLDMLTIPPVQIHFKKDTGNTKTNKFPYFLPLCLFFILMVVFIVLCNQDIELLFKAGYCSYISKRMQLVVNCLCDNMYTVKTAFYKVLCIIQEFIMQYFT
ncbi:tripartite motif-containing protein 59 [Bombina bombina]|uniref:tripartite motif-containing protein 59 n=1 Tax=Bombina bombina TaxID=8345 RepID=UPI00235A64F9|nr:tripartite motif-containing protein 59 [Bombina bombina]XP_053566078.1 tripartite motif-containing protein 59 [Bombina bombina]